MALPSNKIFLRSPYWISKSRSALDYIIVDLYVWNGDLTLDVPSEPTITLRATAFNGKATLDIAEYARDYVEPTFNGSETSNAVWVRYSLQWYDTDGTQGTDSSVTLTGLDGFSYFEDQLNYQHPYNVLLGQDRVVTSEVTNFVIPVLQDKLKGYILQKRTPLGYYVQFHAVTGLTPTEDTSSVVKYISTSYQGVYADRVEFDFGSSTTEYVYIDYEDCSRWGTTNVYFVNRYGAVQRVDFFGRKDVSLTTESDMYKRNLISGGTYDETKHQMFTLRKNGKIKMSLNTGWYKEEDNDIFVEMALSEQIWVRVDRDELGLGWLPKTSTSFVVPVNMTTTDWRIKKKLTDKMINYTLEFEAASDRINTVR